MFTSTKASLHRQRDRLFRSSGRRRRKQHTLSYWVISKRKFGVPRNSFVHPKKKKKINENFPLGRGRLFCAADNKKIQADLFAFQRPLSKYRFQVQNKYPHCEQTGWLRRYLTFAFIMAFFLSSLTCSKRRAPAAGSGSCTFASSEISGRWVVTPRCEPGGLCHSQTVAIGTLPEAGGGSWGTGK